MPDGDIVLIRMGSLERQLQLYFTFTWIFISIIMYGILPSKNYTILQYCKNFSVI